LFWTIIPCKLILSICSSVLNFISYFFKILCLNCCIGIERVVDHYIKGGMIDGNHEPVNVIVVDQKDEFLIGKKVLLITMTIDEQSSFRMSENASVKTVIAVVVVSAFHLLQVLDDCRSD
jgi:hypothetical protein